MCYYYSHNVPEGNCTVHPWCLQRVQSYLVLHLRTTKRLATNKQNARTQRRSLKEDGVDSIEVIILWGVHKEHKAEATTTPQNGENCHYLISFVLSV